MRAGEPCEQGLAVRKSRRWDQPDWGGGMGDKVASFRLAASKKESEG